MQGKRNHVQNPICLLLLILLLSLNAASVDTAASQVGFVNYSYLNLRSGPSTNASLIVRLSEKDALIIEKVLDDWYQVRAVHEGKVYEGYASKSYITLKSLSVFDADAYVSYSFLNLRKEASTCASLVVKLSEQDPVMILEAGSDWYKIKALHMGSLYNGYAHKDYIKKYTSDERSGYVNYSYLNMRKAPDTGAALIVKLSLYDPVTIKKTLTDWYQVSAVHDNKTCEGYVSKKYITLGRPPKEESSSLPAVTMKSIFLSDTGTLKITWEKVSGADGYLVYRKKGSGDYKKIASLSASRNSYSQAGLDTGTKYTYLVKAYELINGKKIPGKTGRGIAPTLPYTNALIKNTTKTYLGSSGAGRSIYSYQVGSGKNHIVITAAVHGYEDSFKKDGSLLVKTAENLLKILSGKLTKLNAADTSVIVIPMSNPDGIFDGSSNKGPGRCTTWRYDSSGRLIKGGLDINRSFPTGFISLASARYYTGSKPLLSKESRILKSFIDSNKGSGKNSFIDVHGWYDQTITKEYKTGALYRVFKKYFPTTKEASFLEGSGYISRYADSKGYRACLFEFPYVASEEYFNQKGYGKSFVNAILALIGHQD